MAHRLRLCLIPAGTLKPDGWVFKLEVLDKLAVEKTWHCLRLRLLFEGVSKNTRCL